jgi:hypothetical protein
VGAVLQQDQGKGLQPIAFLSKKLGDAETRYPVHEQELLGIILALREWRHYLYGQHFTIISDHHSLQYLHSQPHLSPRQSRWVEFLQQFNFTICYKPGKTNIVADALSRRSDYRERHVRSNPLPAAAVATPAKRSRALSPTPSPTHTVLHVATAIAQPIRVSSFTSPELLARIKAAYPHDPICSALLNSPPQSSSNRDFTVEDGLLRKNGKLYIPSDPIIKTALLNEVHDTPISGHFGVTRTYRLLSQDVFWPDMIGDVKKYVSTCLQCQLNKPTNQLPAGLLQPLPIPSRRWEQVSLDLITQLPPSRQGNDCIVVFVDKLSKMVHYTATTTSVTAVQLADIFFRDVVRHHGVPTSLISDRDPRFTSNFWRALWSLLGTRLRMSTAYHPQSDGQTERANRTLEETLRAYVNERIDDWDEHLVSAEIAVNNSVQESTGFTPFYLNSGQHPHFPLSHALAGLQASKNPAAADYIQQLSSDLTLVQQNLSKAQERQARATDRHRRQVTWREGDEALLSTTHLNAKPHKLLSRFIGPFLVTKVLSPNAVQLQLPSTFKIHSTFNVDRLRPFKKDVNNSFPGRQQSLTDRPLPTVDPDGEERYEVEEILGKRQFGRGRTRRTQFLVAWTGYPRVDATWEDEKDMNQAKEALQDYEEREAQH